MTLWMKLGWRNLWRNRRRTLIQLSAISGAVFLATWFHALQIGMYADMINTGTRTGSGHVGVYHEGYLKLRKTELVLEAGPVLAALEGVPEIEAVFPRLHVPGLARSSRASRGVAAMGVDFDREEGGTPLLDPKRLSQGRLPKNGKEALIGEELAKELGIKLRKKFVWMGQGRDGKIVSKLYRVSGMLKTGIRDVDARVMLVRRDALSAAIGREDGAHEIATILRDYRKAEAVEPRIQAAIAGIPEAEAFSWKTAMPEIWDMIQFDHTSGLFIYGFLYLLVGIGTVNTLLMSVVERKREFGVIRALGLGKRDVLRIVAAEGLVLACLGVLIGWGLAILLGLYTCTEGIDFSSVMESYEAGGAMIEPVIRSAWDWSGGFLMGVSMALIALLASWYPARRVLKTQPADAMRSY